MVAEEMTERAGSRRSEKVGRRQTDSCRHSGGEQKPGETGLESWGGVLLSVKQWGANPASP